MALLRYGRKERQGSTNDKEMIIHTPKSIWTEFID
jgi:hypothetical protein